MNRLQNRRGRLSKWLIAIAVVWSVQISYAGDNMPPVAQLMTATPFVNEATTLSYILFNEDDDVDENLTYALYVYPNNRLVSVEDIRIFATLIADQRDLTYVEGTGDFTEGTAADDVQEYTWDDPGIALSNQGFAPADKILPGDYYVYLVVDDGVNAPVIAVSDYVVRVNDLVATAVESSSWGQIKTKIVLY
jgi:hypothetical protein